MTSDIAFFLCSVVAVKAGPLLSHEKSIGFSKPLSVFFVPRSLIGSTTDGSVPIATTVETPLGRE